MRREGSLKRLTSQEKGYRLWVMGKKRGFRYEVWGGIGRKAEENPQTSHPIPHTSFSSTLNIKECL